MSPRADEVDGERSKMEAKHPVVEGLFVLFERKPRRTEKMPEAEGSVCHALKALHPARIWHLHL